MKLGLIIFVVACVLLAVAACNRKARQANSEVASRLSSRLKLRSDYLVLVGVPIDAPTKWARATSYSADEIVTVEGRVRVASVRAFVIAYPNQQVLDAETLGLEIPDELRMLHSEEPATSELINVTDAQAGLRFVDVSYGPSAVSPTADHYSTTLRNIGDEPVRVLKFGAFAETEGRYVLSTVTSNFFTADEFVSWYGAPADGWILPATAVTDPDNYGAPPVLWAYYCETKSGKRFVTGAVVTNRKR
jgi:hypothetical protein